MAKRLVHTFLILGCFVTTSMAQVKRVSLKSVHTIKNDAQIEEWIEHYYEHPRPDLAASALTYAGSRGLLARERVETPSTYFLFEEFLRANPSAKSDFLTAAKNGSLDVKKAAAFALWMSGQADAAELDELSTPDMAAYIAELKQEKPVDILSSDDVSPTLLDALWAGFYIKGEDKYVERIASFLPLIDAKNDPMTMAIGSAASWSLKSNAMQQPRVLGIVMKLANQATGRQKELLKQTLSPIVQEFK